MGHPGPAVNASVRGLSTRPVKHETPSRHRTPPHRESFVDPEPTTAPPAPGLVTESLRAGQWLFRWRSYPPLVVLAYVLLVVALDPAPAGGAAALPVWVALGLASGLLGLAIRGWTVGHVAIGTSGRGTRELRAEELNTGGIYSLVRHPLYLGNFFMWMGVVIFAGKPTAMLVTVLAFWLYYERIMTAEERFLYEKFGDAFAAWADKTPPFLPRFGGWKPWPYPFSFRFVLGRDYQALYGFVASTAVVALLRVGVARQAWAAAVPWAWYFAAGTVAYFVLHTLKRRTRLLEPRDRR
jgi:protein-S-isoprenylcysteine O-methyltransferase Ste14